MESKGVLPKVSVIIPVHNGGKRVRRSAMSVLNQDYKNLELILVENGSTDNTWKTCRVLAKNDDRCKALQSDVQSTLITRKVGIEQATGDYIAFCDADDRYYSPSSISKLLNAAERTQADITQFGCMVNRLGRYRVRCTVTEEVIVDRVQLLEEYIAGAGGGGYNQTINPSPWNKLYKASVLKSIAPDLNLPMIMGGLVPELLCFL